MDKNVLRIIYIDNDYRGAFSSNATDTLSS